MRNFRKKSLIILIAGVFVLANNSAAGQELNLDPQETINRAGITGIKGINVGQALNRFQFNLPSSWEKINVGTSIPVNIVNTSQGLPDIDLKQFLTPRDISSDDLTGATKAIVELIIEIFLVVISITAQILKLVLEFLRMSRT